MKRVINALLLVCIVGIILPSLAFTAAKKREYYQITVYQFNSAEQQRILDDYLKNAYLPALHKAGIRQVGVFTPIANDTAASKSLYVIMPLKNLDQLVTLPQKLAKDKQYAEAGSEYFNRDYKNPPYTRMEHIVLQAFSMAPTMNVPQLKGPRAERVYELRSYEGHTEKIWRNKVQMFNEGGEIAIFKKLNFNAVFYAEVIAGSRMPNLMYMTSFENRADRDAHWRAFSADPDWKKLSAMPEYQNNVSRNQTILMRSTPYSDY